MEERKEETKKGTEGRLVVGMAVAVLVVILCLMLDVRLGVGALVGIVAGSFLRPMLKDLFADEPQEEPEENRFLDTAVLRENFSIPQNLPIPYAVLDIRGRVMMYNEPFAAVFPNSEDAKSVIEVLRKTSGRRRTSESYRRRPFLQSRPEPLRCGGQKRRCGGSFDPHYGGHHQNLSA